MRAHLSVPAIKEVSDPGDGIRQAAASEDAGGKTKDVHDPNDFCFVDARDLEAWMLQLQRFLDQRFHELQAKMEGLPKKARRERAKANGKETSTRISRQSAKLEAARKSIETARSSRKKSIELVREALVHSEAQGGKMMGRYSSVVPTGLEVIVRSPVFVNSVAIVVFLNACFMGLRVERLIANKGSESSVFGLFERLFSIIFLVEIVLRLWALKKKFFLGKERVWNIFDLSLVSLSTFELLMDLITLGGGGIAESVIKLLRILRGARVVRVVRLLRMFTDLQVMVGMIINSMRSLFWILVLLFSIMYVFGIVFTQGAIDFLYVDGYDESQQDLALSVNETYGSLIKTIFSLFKSMSGGVSWGELVAPLQALHFAYVGLYICYIFLAIFSLSNIVTGVFVDSAIQSGKDERDVIIQREKKRKEALVTDLRRLLCDLDEDGGGDVSYEEFVEKLANEDVQLHFAAMEIDSSDSHELFMLLDDDDSGSISIDEFIEGCMRLKGMAKQIDIQKLCLVLRRETKQLRLDMYEMLENFAHNLASQEDND
eukprot:TRINITY_DN2656_c0_g1_i1.p1 TRINITY_DN2656_c0_g1~~TRINITY_DN2656_c0_g1_i1.p1  ORF type:complete len:544 (-),score=117.86 TRINITY_DN2656_c0_g1_i1:105-1736(-)